MQNAKLKMPRRSGVVLWRDKTKLKDQKQKFKNIFEL